MNIDNLDRKKSFYEGLNERQRRHFLAIESQALGYGGITIVSQTFKVSRTTIHQGIKELNLGEQLSVERIRKEGGGRKKNSNRTESYKGLCSSC